MVCDSGAEKPFLMGDVPPVFLLNCVCCDFICVKRYSPRTEQAFSTGLSASSISMASGTARGRGLPSTPKTEFSLIARGGRARTNDRNGAQCAMAGVGRYVELYITAIMQSAQLCRVPVTETQFSPMKDDLSGVTLLHIIQAARLCIRESASACAKPHAGPGAEDRHRYYVSQRCIVSDFDLRAGATRRLDVARKLC